MGRRHRAKAGAVYFAMDEADVKRVLAYPSAMVGSDGLPPTTEGEVRLPTPISHPPTLLD